MESKKNNYLFDKSKSNHVNVASVLFRNICLVMFDINN